MKEKSVDQSTIEHLTNQCISNTKQLLDSRLSGYINIINDANIGIDYQNMKLKMKNKQIELTLFMKEKLGAKNLEFQKVIVILDDQDMTLYSDLRFNNVYKKISRECLEIIDLEIKLAEDDIDYELFILLDKSEVEGKERMYLVRIPKNLEKKWREDLGLIVSFDMLDKEKTKCPVPLDFDMVFNEEMQSPKNDEGENENKAPKRPKRPKRGNSVNVIRRYSSSPYMNSLSYRNQSIYLAEEENSNSRSVREYMRENSENTPMKNYLDEELGESAYIYRSREIGSHALTKSLLHTMNTGSTLHNSRLSRSGLSTAIRQLQAGFSFIKYGRYGKPHTKLIHIDDFRMKIIWKNTKKPNLSKFILVKDIEQIIQGRERRNFRKYPTDNADKISASFSIICRKRELDLEGGNKEETNNFLKYLRILIESMKIYC